MLWLIKVFLINQIIILSSNFDRMLVLPHMFKEKYPNLNRKERENAITKEYKAVFTQTLLVDSDSIGKVNKENRTIPITARVIEYFKDSKAIIIACNTASSVLQFMTKLILLQ